MSAICTGLHATTEYRLPTSNLIMERCPGCGLEMPPVEIPYDGYYHTSASCWSVYQEVLAAEFGNAVLFGQVHQLSVDTYAVQHAGGEHPDKSMVVHLVGLQLQLEREVPSPKTAPLLQHLASLMTEWPHFAPPEGGRGPLTVYDVATAGSPLEHADRSRSWARQVWSLWEPHHAAVAALADRVAG